MNYLHLISAARRSRTAKFAVVEILVLHNGKLKVKIWGMPQGAITHHTAKILMIFELTKKIT